MIKDLVSIFKEKYAEVGDKVILDSYTLKLGAYFKINIDGSFDYSLFDKKSDINSEKYKWFSIRDYYSNLLDMNKPIANKQIHSSNYCTVFLKAESLFADFDIFEKIDEYYNVLAHLQEKYSGTSKKNKEARIILDQFAEQMNCNIRNNLILTNHQQIIRLLPEIKEIVESEANSEIRGGYVKIFFDMDLENYLFENKLHTYLNIFNSNEYNIKIDGHSMGLSNSNMGLNAKKPYLELKSKKISIPFLLTLEEATITKKFFDWMNFQNYHYMLPYDDNFGHYDVVFKKGKENIIINYETVPAINNNFTHFEFKNFLQLTDTTNTIISNIYQLEELVDEFMYQKQLKRNYFSKITVSKFMSKGLQNYLFLTRDSMRGYFHLYHVKPFLHALNKYGDSLITLDLLSSHNIKRSANGMNLKLSIIKYFGGKIMNIESMINETRMMLDNSLYPEITTEQFFFLAGQVTYYLLSLSEASNKKQDLLEPFLRSATAKRLKSDIKFSFDKFKHKLSFSYSKFNNALAIIMAYDGCEKSSNYMDVFLTGYLSNNIFYTK